MGQIIGYFVSLWNFLISTIKAFSMALDMAVGSVTFLQNFMSYLPTAIASGVIIFLTVYVVRFLLLK